MDYRRGRYPRDAHFALNSFGFILFLGIVGPMKPLGTGGAFPGIGPALKFCISGLGTKSMFGGTLALLPSSFIWVDLALVPAGTPAPLPQALEPKLAPHQYDTVFDLNGLESGLSGPIGLLYIVPPPTRVVSPAPVG